MERERVGRDQSSKIKNQNQDKRERNETGQK